MIEDKILHNILSKAILAPSGDNTQRWQFRLKAQRLELHLNLPKNHKLHFFETGQKMLYVSAGAVIENMRVAAHYLGYEIKVQYFPEAQNPQFVALIEFEETSIRGHLHFEVLDKRVTNRKFYQNEKNKDSMVSIVTLLQKQVEDRGFNLIWRSRIDSEYRALADLMGDADQWRYETRSLYKEFLEVVRQNKNEAEQTKDGLDIRTFEMSPVEKLLFCVSASWKRVSFLNRLGWSRLMNQYTQRQILSSSGVGLITAPGKTDLDYVHGGEKMERLWHEATRLGYSLQPMMAIPVFLLNLDLGNVSCFDSAKQSQMRRLRERFFALLRIPESDTPLFLFRLGKAKAPQTRSLRRPLDSFILKETA